MFAKATFTPWNKTTGFNAKHYSTGLTHCKCARAGLFASRCARAEKTHCNLSLFKNNLFMKKLFTLFTLFCCFSIAAQAQN
ncbi:MAG TPA: hypothetical protein VLZ33_04150, partial [Dysgonamonadaceae bacterium]|nr:hypothetical protein [Dysgonamonadaceae bacterium]